MLLETETFEVLAAASRRTIALGIFPIRASVRKRQGVLDRSRSFYWRSRLHILLTLGIQVGLCLFLYVSSYLYPAGRVNIAVFFYLIVVTVLHAVCMQADYLFTWWIDRSRIPTGLANSLFSICDTLNGDGGGTAGENNPNPFTRCWTSSEQREDARTEARFRAALRLEEKLLVWFFPAIFCPAALFYLDSIGNILQELATPFEFVLGVCFPSWLVGGVGGAVAYGAYVYITVTVMLRSHIIVMLITTLGWYLHYMISVKLCSPSVLGLGRLAPKLLLLYNSLRLAVQLISHWLSNLLISLAVGAQLMTTATLYFAFAFEGPAFERLLIVSTCGATGLFASASLRIAGVLNWETKKLLAGWKYNLVLAAGGRHRLALHRRLLRVAQPIQIVLGVYKLDESTVLMFVDAVVGGAIQLFVIFPRE